MAICHKTHDYAGLLPAHSFAPLVSMTGWRLTVTSRARRGRRHDQGEKVDYCDALMGSRSNYVKCQEHSGLKGLVSQWNCKEQVVEKGL